MVSLTVMVWVNLFVFLQPSTAIQQRLMMLLQELPGLLCVSL